MAVPDFAERLARSTERGYVTAFRLLRNGEDARDACQEAARKALAAQDRYDAGRPFHAWFHVILKNHCLDVIKSRHRQVADDTVGERAAEPGTQGPRRADTVAMQSERHRALHQAIAGLEPDLREMIELRHFADLSYAEMADVLGCPEGTVMSRLYRARKALRSSLGAEWKEATP